MRESGRILNELAAEIVLRATAQHPQLDAAPVLSLLPAGVSPGSRLFPHAPAGKGDSSHRAIQVLAHG
jgi:hypothetical protein